MKAATVVLRAGFGAVAGAGMVALLPLPAVLPGCWPVADVDARGLVG